MNAIQRLHTRIADAGIPILSVSGDQSAVRIDFAPAATAAQRTAATALVTSHDWSAAADATDDARLAKAMAKWRIENGTIKEADNHARLSIAIVLLMLDELNSHAKFCSDLKAAIGAATSLADLKTRVVTILDLSQRTPVQVRAAIVSKIDATAE